jgi:integrase
MISDNFDTLLKQIKAGGLDTFSQEQLICISQLVLFSGIGKTEIIDLVVGDVIDGNGKVVRSIDRFEKPITLTEGSQRALQDYLKTPTKRHLKLLKRKNPLFPGFRNAKKLERAWKSVATHYSEILDWGINKYHLTGLSQGMKSGDAVAAAAVHFRHTRRSISAHVAGKPIRPGNFDVIRESMELLEQAGTLTRDNPDSIMKAIEIIKKFAEIEKKALSPAQKRDIETMRPFIDEAVNPFLG